jgi:hypothetical protein
MRLLSLGLLAMGIVANYDLITPSSPYAGRVGWYFLLSQQWTAESWHVLLGILPLGIASIASLYFSLALWRYGTSYSMVVHASPFNPWFSPFFGSLALIGSQFFDYRWFLLLSNLGIFVFVESVLLLFMEVNKDMQAATDLIEFLDAIGEKREELQMLKRDHHPDNKFPDNCSTHDVGQEGDIELAPVRREPSE